MIEKPFISSPVLKSMPVLHKPAIPNTGLPVTLHINVIGLLWGGLGPFNKSGCNHIHLLSCNDLFQVLVLSIPSHLLFMQASEFLSHTPNFWTILLNQFSRFSGLFTPTKVANASFLSRASQVPRSSEPLTKLPLFALSLWGK